MRILIIAGAFLMLPLIAGITGIDLTKTGPMVPPLEMPEHGGGGGP